MENDLIEKIASIEDSISKIQLGIIFILILLAVGFIGIILLIGYLNNTLRLIDHHYCLFDSLPFRVRLKVLTILDKKIKADVDAYISDLEK